MMAVSDEYLTPEWLFKMLAISFDMDVASPLDGISWVPANTHITQVENGLLTPWSGRVWMNPPYSQSAPWVTRFMEHRHGIALLPHCRSRWHRQLWADADGIADPNANTPKGTLFQFVRYGRDTNVYMPVMLAAYGKDCVDAIARAGPVRVISWER